MLTFHHIRRIKSLLKISLFALSLARGAIAWGTDYTWNDSVTSGNWTDSANWLPATGYPGAGDTVFIPGNAETSITLTSDITIKTITFNSEAGSKITLVLNSHSLTCTERVYLVDETENTNSGNVVLTGDGNLQTQSFDFPNQNGDNEHTFVIGSAISDTKTVLTITKTLWANSSKKLTFSGYGYLYMPNGGGNVDYGPSNITYSIDSSHRLPYEGGDATYTCTANVQESTPDGATVTFTKANYDLYSGAQTVRFPFTVSITGSSTYTLNGTQLSEGSYTGNSPSATGTSPITVAYNGSPATFTLSCNATPSVKGEGITIIFYSPDGYNPSDSFMELGRISWYYQTPTWTGSGGDNLWTTEGNWSGISEISDLQNLSDYDIEISVTDTTKCPLIDETMSVSVKSLEITGGSLVTQTGGKLSLSSIKTGTSTGKFIQTGGILELTNDGDTAASINGFSTAFTLKNLSIAENASFSMPFDMSLDLLILNSGCTFSKNSKNLTLGWLQAETHNYSGSSDSDISLTDDFEADSIIIRLRDGNVYAEKSLTAKKDFIIGGAKYNSSALKYPHFTKRPDSWYQDFADTDLEIEDGVSVDESSALILSSGVVLTAGTSGQGNLYINGATLTGDSSTNSLVIPQNDSPENFCAEAVNSVISNINVICSDGSTDGSKAQLPAEGCTLTNSANFDDADFEITQAYTVSDCRIFLEFDGGSSGRELRNNGGELNLSSVLAAITTSDSSSFTAAYGSKNGSDEPEENPSSFYLYTSNTSWNTDASGDYSGSGNYTDSSGDYRTVTPYLTIPQYISGSNGNISCGYVITDKWGKRLKSYSPFTSVADGIPEAEKCTRSYPTFKTVSGCIGSDRIILSFTSPIVSDISKLSYYDNDSGQAISISESLTSLLPSCFEVFYFDDNGNAVTSDDLKIDSSRNARISESSSSEKLGLVTLYLNRNLTLSDMETYYIRLIQHPSYKGITKDPVTMKSGYYVTFIQQCDKSHSEAGKNYMIMNSAHTISDFAAGAVISSYAYSSGQSSGGESIEDIYKNVYGSNSYAVHDFSKAQKNFGSVTYGTEITLISKGYDGSSSNSSLPYNIRLYISDSPDSASLFSDYNASFGKNLNCWLPALSETESIFENYESSHNSHYWEFSSSLISENEPEKGYTFKIEEDAIKQMAGGSQLSFLYALCDSSKKLLTRYLAPQLNDSVTGTYNLTDSKKVPLFSFTLTDTSDPASLEMWYITLKSITEQRGGVTILNNVINAANGEQTVLKVNMPSSGNLDVIVMTIDGNIIKYLAHGSASAGEHIYHWDGKNKAGSPVSRGLYFVIVKAPGIDENRKVMVVK